MRRLSLFVFFILTITVQAQDITGQWHSMLDVQGIKLRLVLNISEENGSYKTLMDSPDQGAKGIAMEETTVQGNDIQIGMPKLGILIKGTYDASTESLVTTFKQGALETPMTFQRKAIEKPKLVRPQEPTIFPYKQEKVVFKNIQEGHELAGTLTKPKNGKFTHVAILISGSGPQDRNEELFGHKPFMVLADYLTKNGIAVLRYDDRGVGNSGGNFSTATTQEFANDAEAALHYLRKRMDMSGKKIGFIGHSEGGMIAPIVASKTSIDFIVLMAGPGVPIRQLMEEQMYALGVYGGQDSIQARKATDIYMKAFDHIIAHPETPKVALKKELKSIVTKALAKINKTEINKLGPIEESISGNSFVSPWFRYFLAFDPAEYLTKVTCPVLAINGEKDRQVLCDSNLQGIATSLAKSGHKDFTIKAFKNLNHLFQTSSTGSPSEYGQIQETFSPNAMAYMASWISLTGQE